MYTRHVIVVSPKITIGIDDLINAHVKDISRHGYKIIDIRSLVAENQYFTDNGKEVRLLAVILYRSCWRRIFHFWHK